MDSSSETERRLVWITRAYILERYSSSRVFITCVERLLRGLFLTRFVFVRESFAAATQPRTVVELKCLIDWVDTVSDCEMLSLFRRDV